MDCCQVSNDATSHIIELEDLGAFYTKYVARDPLSLLIQYITVEKVAKYICLTTVDDMGKHNMISSNTSGL